MKTHIHDEQIFTASPAEVYEALMDSERHAKFTEALADISREIGAPSPLMADI
jgi:uncharacterized protein YndB with AHSA1/START domain